MTSDIHRARSVLAPELLIRIKRQKDGGAALSCQRRDGSVTWQRQDGKLGGVFPHHDLTHLAVETTLGYRHAFYGLLADGWEISDFATPWPRGPVPAEALEVELLVGFFDMERMMNARWTTEEFNEQALISVEARRGWPRAPRVLTGDEIERVRAARADAFARWARTEAGDTLELPFDRSAFAN